MLENRTKKGDFRMMIRKFTLLFLLIFSFVIVGVSRDGTEELAVEYDIVYLDDDQGSRGMKLSSSKNDSDSLLELDVNRDAYVLNEVSFSKLSKDSASDYLKQGGIIVVNDNLVKYDDLIKKIDTKVAFFDYSDTDNQYGFYIYNDSLENIVVNVSLGFLGSNDDVHTETEIISEEIEKETIVESIVSTAAIKTLIISDDDGGGGTGTAVQTNTTGTTIAYGYLENYLYNLSTGEFVCIYSIHTQIFDVAKVTNVGSSLLRGVYDLASTYSVKAEANWAVAEYTIRMSSPFSITDESVLNSGTSTLVSLSENLGFQANVMFGDLSEGLIYTNSANYQKITDDFRETNSKYWKSVIPMLMKNYGYLMKPSIRIVNDNDVLSTSQFSRVESLILSDKHFPYEHRLYMLDAYRKELKVVWNSYGLITQSVITG